jgi:predicted dithiol-disulfide oxidoreductase (DUF899 family)
MTNHKVVTHQEWQAARDKLLAEEKELTRRNDELAKKRRELPWVPVEEEYTFETDEGTKSLAELFDGRSQLLIYHFMFGPEYEAGCPVCSSIADNLNANLPHLGARDVTMICVSRAPLEKLQAYRKRMGWKAKWASSWDSDFNYDFHVSFTKEELEKGKVYYNYDLIEGFDELPGLSVFYKDENGDVFHTYSSYARGNEEVNGVFIYLDITPKGRNETEIMDWVRRHDEYVDTLRRTA